MLNKKALAASLSAKETDADFKQTVLLLHGDGTNGAQNNTFTDSSTNAFTITRNGNTTQGTFSPFSNSDGYWSALAVANGTNSIDTGYGGLSGTGDYTVSFWIYLNSWTGGDNNGGDGGFIYIYDQGNSHPTYPFAINITKAGKVTITDSANFGSSWYSTFNSAGSYNTSYSIGLNAWHYIHIVRSSGTLSIYANGNLQFSTSQSNSMAAAYANGKINPGNGFDGYISNFRIVTSAITDATSPTAPSSTSTTNQVFLGCASNRFIDRNTATTAKTVTKSGTISIQAFSPFAPTAAYSAATNGGSGYFDGTGDYLETSSSSNQWAFGTGNFTVELWLYTSAATNRVIMANRSGSTGLTTHWSLEFFNTAKRVEWHTGVAIIASSNTDVQLNAWVHIAVVRNSNTLKIYQNGVEVASATDNNDYSSVNPLLIANEPVFPSGNNPFLGFMSSIRIVKGTAVYTSNFTPPTAPLTNITNTSFLANFTNAGITDATAKNVLETVGNAQIDTGTKKFGTGSLEFDGNGDYLVVPAGVNWSFGTGDFTVETWVYLNSVSNNGTIICNSGYAGNSGDWIIRIGAAGSASGKWEFTIYGAASTYDQVYSNSAPSTGSWVHLAAVRSSGTMMLFIDGTKQTVTDTSTNAAGFTNQTTVIVGDNSSGVLLNCFLDEFRVTKGVARYTANFTVPSKAFADQ